MLFVKGDGNAPVKRRSGYAQIFQPGTQEIVQHFLLAGNGLYKIRMAFNMLDQPFLIFRETKEIAFLLLCMLHRSAAVRAFSAIQLRFSPKSFARRTVPAFIFAFINISLIVQLLEDLLNGCDVAFIRSPNKAVVGYAQDFPQFLDSRYDPVDVLFRRNSVFLRLPLNLEAVLVGACKKHDVIALKPSVPGLGVGRNRCIRMSDMKIVAGIINRSRNIICGLLHAHILLSFIL